MLEKITQTLEQVDSLEDLLKEVLPLEELFCDLVEIIIKARMQEHPKVQQRKENKDQSDLLRQEMKRICQIEGAKMLFEKIQRKSLERLHAFEKKRMKKIEIGHKVL